MVRHVVVRRVVPARQVQAHVAAAQVHLGLHGLLLPPGARSSVRVPAQPHAVVVVVVVVVPQHPLLLRRRRRRRRVVRGAGVERLVLLLSLLLLVGKEAGMGRLGR